MRVKMIILRFSCLLFFVVVVKSQESVFEYDSDWIAPDAWSRHRASQPKGTVQNQENKIDSGPEHVMSEKSTCAKHKELLEISEMFYKRLVKSLFKKQKFKEITPDLVLRTIQLKLNYKILDQISSLIDDNNQDSVRDLDAIVTAIILESEGGFIGYVKDEVVSVLDRAWKLINKILENQILKLLFLALIFVLVAILLQKKWGCNLLLVMFIMMLVIGYGFTYLNCNYNLEMREIAKYIKHGYTNPCNEVETTNEFSFWTLFAGNPRKDKCVDHLHNQKIHIDVCLPHDVLIEFSSEIYSKVFEKYFVGTINAFSEATKSYSYMGQIFAFSMFTTIVIVFGKEIVGTTIRSFFKYGLFGSTATSKASRRNSEPTHKREAVSQEATIILARTLETLVNQHHNKTPPQTNLIENRIEDISTPDAIESTTSADNFLDDFEHIQASLPEEIILEKFESKEEFQSSENKNDSDKCDDECTELNASAPIQEVDRLNYTDPEKTKNI